MAMFRLPPAAARFRAAWFLPVAAAVLLGGCEDLFTPSAAPRNYDELVKRIVDAIQGRTPEEAAANLFNVTSPDERRDAIAYLETKSWGHGAPYLRAYEILSTDPHPMVRAQAMRALGTSHQAAEGTFLVKGLNDANVQVRRDAACGLVTTWTDEAAAPLAALLKGDEDDQVRVFAARALAHAHTPDAIRALIDTLNDKDAAVVRYAHASLAAATGQDFSYDNRAWLSWFQKTYVTPASTAPAGGTPAFEMPTFGVPTSQP